MEIKGKEVALIVYLLEQNGNKELAEKVINHFNDLNERFAETWWTKEDVKSAFEKRTGKLPTEEQLEEALYNLNIDLMEERQVESGWEQVYNAVDMVIKGE